MPSTISSLLEAAHESEQESSEAMDKLGFNDDPCLNKSEKQYIGRILGNLQTSPDIKEDFSDSDLMLVNNRDINDAIYAVTQPEGIQIPFTDVLAIKTKRTINSHFPFSGQLERIGSAVRTIAFSKEQTIVEVLNEGAANCLDWATGMQMVGRARYPESRATIVPYGPAENDRIDRSNTRNTLGFHSHYGIAFYDDGGALSYSVMGGHQVREYELQNPSQLLESLKESIRETVNNETEVIGKAGKLLRHYQSLRQNYLLSIAATTEENERKNSIADIEGKLTSREEVQWAFEEAIKREDRERVRKLRIRFPTYQQAE